MIAIESQEDPEDSRRQRKKGQKGVGNKRKHKDRNAAKLFIDDKADEDDDEEDILDGRGR